MVLSSRFFKKNSPFYHKTGFILSGKPQNHFPTRTRLYMKMHDLKLFFPLTFYWKENIIITDNILRNLRV